MSTIIKNFFRDKNNQVVIFQNPNGPLVVWLVLTLASLLPLGELFKNITSTTATLALLVWALLEITAGVNTFRKTLGVFVFLMATYSLSRLLIS